MHRFWKHKGHVVLAMNVLLSIVLLCASKYGTISNFVKQQAIVLVNVLVWYNALHLSQQLRSCQGGQFSLPHFTGQA